MLKTFANNKQDFSVLFQREGKDRGLGLYCFSFFLKAGDSICITMADLWKHGQFILYEIMDIFYVYSVLIPFALFCFEVSV